MGPQAREQITLPGLGIEVRKGPKLCYVSFEGHVGAVGSIGSIRAFQKQKRNSKLIMAGM